MPNIWITSDTHFGHDRDFIWKPRGFNSVDEMNNEIIKRWNEKVQQEDIVYHLGDVMLNDNDYGLSCLKQLKGKIHIIRGNHCTDARIALYKECLNVVEVCDAKYLKVGKQSFFLSHYPCLTSNFDMNKPLNRRIINLCGHTHCKNKYKDMDKGLIYHVELDAHNCKPISIEEIIKDIKTFISLDKDAQKRLCENDT